MGVVYTKQTKKTKNFVVHPTSEVRLDFSKRDLINTLPHHSGF
jgi:hypothetical protein